MVTLTAPAAQKVKELMESEGGEELVLRLAVKPGGCSGFSYEMFFDSELDESDNIAEYEGVRVAVDSQSLQFLQGAEVDYTEGLMGTGFAINNPNVSRSCGCGNSFA